MPRNIEQLVNLQVTKWLEDQARLAHESSAGSRVRELQRPSVTISREFGAQGGEIGRRVAERLGIAFYSQEILHEVARRANVRKQVLEALDERTQTRLEAWIDDLLVLHRFTQSDYLRNLSETVLALSRQRPSVLVGRGGHLILNPERTLRVRVFAPIEARIRAVMVRERMGEDEARFKVARVDQERTEFYRRHFDRDVASKYHFDLMLNSGQMSLDECAEVIEHLFRLRFGREFA